MGISDRDYYREPETWANPFSRSQVTFCLIFTYILVFLAQIATLPPKFVEGPNPLGLTNTLELTAAGIFQGDVWRVFSYGLIHHPQDIVGLIATVIMLVWLGRTVEEEVTSPEYLALFFVSTIGGGLAFTLYAAISTVPVGVLRGSVVFITMLLTVFVMRDIYRRVNLFGVIPVPGWLILVLYVSFSISNHGFDTLPTALFVTQLFGVLLGVSYHRSTVKILSWLPSGDSAPRPRPPKSKLRIFQESLEPEPATASVSSSGSSAKPTSGHTLDEHFEAKLDEVLEKMNRSGKASLTESEQQVLLRASEYYKKRRQ